MAVTPSTRRHLDDHLGQAEFALKVAANFGCLQGTPAHESVRAALTQVSEARIRVRTKLSVSHPIVGPGSLATRRWSSGVGWPAMRHEPRKRRCGQDDAPDGSHARKRWRRRVLAEFRSSRSIFLTI